ncbi:MAG: LacI family DNA-binding transcriptional regulator [Clostridia bacterium]|nr:LacI family DNA-binding transcriptional regulator [Clostridia bacterium]
MVYLADIAKEAGVSVATVSRVMNNHPAISDETKARVVAAAQKLGYRRSVAKPVAKSPTNSVGVLIPDILTDYYTRIVYFLGERFAKKNYSIVTMCTNYDQEQAVRAVQQMAGFGVRCMVIMLGDSEEISDQLTTAVRASGIPVMFITPNYIPTMDFDCLYLDERRGNAMAVEHLLHRGYQKIAFIGDRNTVNSREIFAKTLKIFKAEVNPEFVRVGPERLERGGYLRMKEILALKELPDAVYCSYDQMAVGAIHAIREAGLRVPGDIAVMGLDDIAVSEYINGGLTTIAAPYDDMASIAVRILMHRVEMPYSQPQQIAIKPSMAVRSTT